ncbi:MAG: leucine-rich repeat protein [Ruminococcus sp.]|nr:leucine-rich repeat protein [Ruminococcus sp.]
MLKKVCSLLLAIVMLTAACSTLTVNAAEKEESSYTPNVSTLTLRSDKSVSKYYNDEGEEVDLSDLNASTFSRRRVLLPSKFDLRDEGRSTSVKDQGLDGYCWSFASNASMESSILTKKLSDVTYDNLDLSETGGVWFSCNGTTDESDSTYGDFRDDPNIGAAGGSAEDAAESISSGYGAYPEELAKYNDVKEGYSKALRYYSDYRFKDYSQLPQDVNLIKQRLMEHGAMYYAYKSFEENYYETKDGEFTYSDNGKSIYGEDWDTGHGVSIIGWDDNFSKDNFHPDASVKNDGAWICKNSWGEDWGKDGYFYISYESYLYCIGQFQMQDKDSFDTIHQHQTTSEQYLFGGNDEGNPQYFSSANVFTAETQEKLEQICYTNAVNSNVKAKIYKLNRDYKTPVDGELLAEFDSNVEYAGTHCIDVPGSIMFNKGDIFSVIIEGEALITNFRYEDAEHPTNDKSDISYFSDNGTDWTDVADYCDASYAAIKAYTTKTSVDKTELKNLVKTIKDYKPSNDGEQVLYDNNYSDLKPLLEKADELINDDSVTNTDINNFCCVLESKFETLKMESFSVNNLDDFKTLYEGVHTGEFKNRYVEFNTDLDLSGFDAEYSDCGENGGALGSNVRIFTSGLYLNGNGHTINNYNEELSLLGYLNDSTVKNLNIENCTVNGDQEASILVNIARYSKFSNINVKNSTVNTPDSPSAALIASTSDNCTFMDCNAENCKIVSAGSTGMFFVDRYGDSKAINCKAKNYTMNSYDSIDDNMGFIYAYQLESGYGIASIKVTDDVCTIEQLIGEIKSVKHNGVEITPVGSQYHADRTNGSVIFGVVFADEPCEFDVYADLENRTAKISGYLGTDKDIVIPERILGLDVIGFDEMFFLHGMDPADVNSITVPGVIKSIPRRCFTQISGLKKIVLNNGVEEICDRAFENCKQLTEITLPLSVSTIGNNAFYNCGAKSVTLGKNIQSIGDHALGYIEIDSEVSPIDGFTIYGYSGTAAETYANANGFNFVDLSVCA